jgi:polysaccharide export outer membrane protein
MRRFTYCVLSTFLAALVPLTAAQADGTVVRNTSNSADIQVDANQFIAPNAKKPQEQQSTYAQFNPANYTLGPNDIVDIEVLRHPEFSDKYVINEDGKIQYKFVGDIYVKGMSKQELEDKVKKVLTKYLVSPEVSVTILEYGSKVFYMMGEIGTPGQFTMKSDGITLREAIHLAGLPTINASLRKCRLVTPTSNGQYKIRVVDLYSLLYYGDLRDNIVIRPGDIFYVPSTSVTKAIRILSPITTLVGLSASTIESIASGRTAAHDLKKNISYNQ